MDTELLKNVIIKPILSEKKRGLVGGGASGNFSGNKTSKEINVNQYSIGLIGPPQP